MSVKDVVSRWSSLRDVVQSFGKICYLVSVQDSLTPLPTLSILYGFSQFMKGSNIIGRGLWMIGVRHFYVLNQF